MSWKGIIQDVVIIATMFAGFYFIHRSALRQETTKITQHIDQKFKRTGNVSTMPVQNATIQNDSCIPFSELSKREQRRINRQKN